MLLFLDEDRSYLNWISHHREGYVLDCLRQPTPRHLVLHRATCSDIRIAKSKRTHWTTGRHMKGCSLDAGELRAWTLEQVQAEPECCSECAPDGDACQVHLTRFDRNILDFVLEIAASHLDEIDFAYGLTVGMIARTFNKTEGQLTASLLRLVAADMLTLAEPLEPGGALPFNSRVAPTAKALHTLPAFAHHTARQLQRELKKLEAESAMR
jgi:hypothetical protein